MQKLAFQTVVKPDVQVHVQDLIALNFSMEVGSEAESITGQGSLRLLIGCIANS